MYTTDTYNFYFYDSRRIKEFVYAMFVATYLHTESIVAVKKPFCGKQCMPIEKRLISYVHS